MIEQVKGFHIQFFLFLVQVLSFQQHIQLLGIGLKSELEVHCFFAYSTFEFYFSRWLSK